MTPGLQEVDVLISMLERRDAALDSILQVANHVTGMLEKLSLFHRFGFFSSVRVRSLNLLTSSS